MDDYATQLQMGGGLFPYGGGSGAVPNPSWENLRQIRYDRSATDQAIKALQAAMAKAEQEAEMARRKMSTRDMVAAALAEIKQMREKMDELTAMLATVALTIDEAPTADPPNTVNITAFKASFHQKLGKLLGQP